MMAHERIGVLISSFSASQTSSARCEHGLWGYYVR